MSIAHKILKLIPVVKLLIKLKISLIWWLIVCQAIQICRFTIKLKHKITIAMDHKDLHIFPKEVSWWQTVLTFRPRVMEVIQNCRINHKAVPGLKMELFNQILAKELLRNKHVSKNLFWFIFFVGNTNRRIHISFDKNGIQ